MRRRLLRVANNVLRPFSLELHRSAEDHDPVHSYMKDQDLVDALVFELEGIASPFLAKELSHFPTTAADVRSVVAEFLETYARRPFGTNPGGLGFHGSFWVFLISRLMAPELLIESGVWRGHTSWLLERAQPDAEIHGFDLSLDRVEAPTERVQFHAHDWTHKSFEGLDTESALIFFDCQTNHAKRIREAHERGFRHLLFGVNPPLHKLYTCGQAPAPTANIIVNYDGPARELDWVWKGAERSCRVDPAEIAEARAMVRQHVVFPDVGGPTRYGATGAYYFMAYVRLEER